MVKPAGLFLYPDALAGAAPVTTFKIVTIGEDLTDGVVGGGGPYSKVAGYRPAPRRPGGPNGSGACGAIFVFLLV